MMMHWSLQSGEHWALVATDVQTKMLGAWYVGRARSLPTWLKLLSREVQQSRSRPTFVRHGARHNIAMALRAGLRGGSSEGHPTIQLGCPTCKLDSQPIPGKRGMTAGRRTRK
eukprot:1703467-Amphidinium_carterae.8